jgi:hypothetical protein
VSGVRNAKDDTLREEGPSTASTRPLSSDEEVSVVFPECPRHRLSSVPLRSAAKKARSTQTTVRHPSTARPGPYPRLHAVTKRLVGGGAPLKPPATRFMQGSMMAPIIRLARTLRDRLRKVETSIMRTSLVKFSSAGLVFALAISGALARPLDRSLGIPLDAEEIQFDDRYVPRERYRGPPAYQEEDWPGPRRDSYGGRTRHGDNPSRGGRFTCNPIRCIELRTGEIWQGNCPGYPRYWTRCYPTFPTGRYAQ